MSNYSCWYFHTFDSFYFLTISKSKWHIILSLNHLLAFCHLLEDVLSTLLTISPAKSLVTSWVKDCHVSSFSNQCIKNFCEIFLDLFFRIFNGKPGIFKKIPIVTKCCLRKLVPYFFYFLVKNFKVLAFQIFLGVRNNNFKFLKV